MATTLSLKGYETAVTVLSGAASGELVSLAHGSISAITDGTHGAILVNTTLLDLYGDFTLTTGTLAAAPLLGGQFYLYQWASPDASNYESAPAAGTFNPNLIDAEHLVGVFQFSAVGTSQVLTIKRKPLIPGNLKFSLYNLCGQALPATGSGVVCRAYNLLNT